MTTLPSVLRTPSGGVVINGSRWKAPASAYISNSTILAYRNTLAAEHDIGGSSEQSFTGFASTTGFTTVVCTTPDAVRTEIQAMTASSKLLVKCQWNGALALTTARVTGPVNTSMTPNAGVDWGYDRPDWSVILEPDDGYSPEWGESGSLAGMAIETYGWSKFEIRNMTFNSGIKVTGNSSNYPAQGMISIHDNTILGQVQIEGGRVAHFENNVCTGANAYFKSVTEYTRYWKNDVRNKNMSVDVSQFFPFDSSLDTARRAKIWWAGNTIHSCIDNVTTGNHADVFQYALSSDVHLGNDIIFEFNLIHFDVNGGQVMFSGGLASNNPRNNLVIHNNIAMGNAFSSFVVYDPSGDGIGYIYRNIAHKAASANHPTTDPEPDLEFSPAVSGTGQYWAIENYATGIGGSTLNSVVSTDNITVAKGAGASFFTGNGTWSTNGSGWVTYTAPEDGLTNLAAIKTAIADFFEPIGGWRSAGCGPVDPATWPTTFGSALT